MGILATAATTGATAATTLSFGWRVRVGNPGVSSPSPENTHTNAEFVMFPQGRGKFLAVEMVFVFFYRVSG